MGFVAGPLLFSGQPLTKHRSVYIVKPKSRLDRQLLYFPEDEIWKTCLFFLFLLSGMVTTTVSLIITNENVPEDISMTDLILDQVTYWPAGVVVSETLMALAMITAFVTVLMHKHRSIILRRVFFIVGLMYFYRAITMSITVLPKPDQNWECPKQNSTLTMQGHH